MTGADTGSRVVVEKRPWRCIPARPNLPQMTTRERLHELVDGLEPAAAARLVARWDEVRLIAGEWEPDERQLAAHERAALKEGLADIAAGRTVPADELRARYPAPERG